MDELAETFTKLTGRVPTESDIHTLYRIKDTLNLKNNDAIWLILMALQYYEQLYQAIPQKISQASDNILQTFKATAESTIQAAIETAKTELVKTVTASNKDIARNISRKQMWKWAAICITVTFISLSLVGTLLHYTGSKSGMRMGYVQGYESAKDEKASASWAATEEGHLAYQLAKSGSLSILAKCNQPGWHVEKGICYPRPAKDGRLYGWRVPN